MNTQLDARGAPETKANGGTLHPLKEVMCFVQDFDEGDLAKRDGSPSLTEGKELKDVLVFEDTVHQDEPKLKFWGTYIKDLPAEEMKTVMVFENRPPETTSCRPFLETQKWGHPVGFLPHQAAPLNVLPLLPAEPAQMSEPRLRHIGASYFEGEDGYYYIDHTGNHRRFTDFTIRILAEEKVQTIDDGITVFLNIELKNDQGQKKILRVPAEEWSELASKIERHATAFMVFHDEVHGAREKFKRLIGVLLKQSNAKKVFVRSSWGWGEPLSDGARKFYHGGLEDCLSEKKLLPPVTDPQARYLLFQRALRVEKIGPPEVIRPMVLYSLAAYMDAVFTDAGFPLDFCLMLIGDSGLLKTSTAKELFAPAVSKNDRIFSLRGTAAAFNVLHERAFDDVLVADDFNLEGTPIEVRRKQALINDLKRAFSDKTPRAKYGGNHDVKKYAMRGGCVFTGETNLKGQIKSGELRYLKILFERKMDGEELAYFQENPDIWLGFCGEFIRYLEQNYLRLLAFVKTAVVEGRARSSFKERRLTDDYIHLSVVASVMMEMLNEAGIYGEEAATAWVSETDGVLRKIIERQEENAQVQDPYVQYLVELWNLIGTGAIKIASALNEYLRAPRDYIGYESEGIVMVKKDEAYKVVKDAFWNRNEALPISSDDVSKALKAQGLTKCDKGSCLKKAPSQIQGRPRMLALIMKNCEKFIEEATKNE